MIAHVTQLGIMLRPNADTGGGNALKFAMLPVRCVVGLD